jgi:hypothetical protein
MTEKQEVEEKIIENHVEHMIIIPRDINLPVYVRHEFDQNGFFCPKCNGSLIFMPEKYAKNNLVNQMEGPKEKAAPGDLQFPIEENMNWLKLVVQCDVCGCTDLIGKFLKRIENDYDYTPTITRPVYKKKYQPYTIATTSGIYHTPKRKPLSWLKSV